MLRVPADIKSRKKGERLQTTHLSKRHFGGRAQSILAFSVGAAATAIPAAAGTTFIIAGTPSAIAHSVITLFSDVVPCGLRWRASRQGGVRQVSAR